MSFESDNPNAASGELDPRAELFEVTRALRAHVQVLMQSGAFGLPKAELPVASVSITEPPASLAPQPLNAPRVSPQLQGSHSLQAAQSLQGSEPLEAPSTAAAAAAQNRALPQPRPAAAGAAHTFVIPEAPAKTAAAANAAPSAPRVQAVALSPEEKQRRLTVLAERIAGCTQCGLHERRTQTVFARGTGKSGLCFVGEGPGADEDAQGFPFVGAAGQLLDRMIAAMGLGRDEVYVCNIVKCRPPENRKPLPDEMAACKPYLEEQLEILAPEVIVALGATAVEGLLGVPSGGITRLRGTWKLYKGRIAVMPTFHPAYLLRVPTAKHAVWEDMQSVLRHMGRSVPVRGKQ